MVRGFDAVHGRWVGFPHARGDGPLSGSRKTCASSFSPRPWGWSDINVSLIRVLNVFPTPVGMVRFQLRNLRNNNRFPHARGDGPRILESLA